MSARPYPAMEMLQRPRGLLAGVCARIADCAGVPVWLPRVLFVGLLVLHGGLGLLLYAGLAIFWREPRAERAAPPPPAWHGPVDRFSDLEARLAALEAEALSSEAGLRRAFRDLR